MGSIDRAAFNDLKLYYFAFGTNGRAEPIRLLLENACVPYTLCSISPANGKQFLEDHLGDSPFVFPFIETTAGKRFHGGVPILRLLAQKLDYAALDGDDETAQFLDLVQDYCMDWYNNSMDAIIARLDKRDPAIQVKHEQTTVPKYYGRFEKIYAINKDGPYLLGNKITYVDILVYHTIDDDARKDKLQDQYPCLDAFVKAFEELPRIKAYHDRVRQQA